MNRTQVMVLAFFALAMLSLLVIVVVEPGLARSALRVPASTLPVFLAGLAIFLATLGVGVVRRWRWVFWLVLIAFLAGVLRVATSALQLAAILPPAGPAWYELFQGMIGVAQAVIGLMMVIGFRRSGAWGRF